MALYFSCNICGSTFDADIDPAHGIRYLLDSGKFVGIAKIDEPCHQCKGEIEEEKQKVIERIRTRKKGNNDSGPKIKIFGQEGDQN